MIFFKPKHLRARAEAETELRNDRRGLQPAARRGRRNHIPGTVDDVEMHSVAHDLPHPADCGLACAKISNCETIALLLPQRYDPTESFDRTRSKLQRGFLRDETTAVLV